MNARAESQRNAAMVQTQAISRLEFERGETAYRVAQEEYNAALQMVEMATVGREEDIEAREAEVRALLEACGRTRTGRRNRALIGLLAGARHE